MKRGTSSAFLFMLLWQSLHTLKGLVGWMLLITALTLEQELQTKKPHFRQWCRRLVTVNTLKQRMHLWVAQLGIQDCAKVDDGCWMRPSSNLDRHFSMCSIQARFSFREEADTKKDLRGVQISHWFLSLTLSSMSSKWTSSAMKNSFKMHDHCHMQSISYSKKLQSMCRDESKTNMLSPKVVNPQFFLKLDLKKKIHPWNGKVNINIQNTFN